MDRLHEALGLSEDGFKPCDRIGNLEAKLAPVIAAISETVEPSDKVGYNWRTVMLGDVVISREYVEDATAKGTEEQPYIWMQGVNLVPNAFYSYGGKLYVYMGQAGIAGAEWDGDGFAEW